MIELILSAWPQCDALPLTFDVNASAHAHDAADDNAFVHVCVYAITWSDGSDKQSYNSGLDVGGRQ